MPGARAYSLVPPGMASLDLRRTTSLRRLLTSLLFLASFAAIARDPPPFDPAGDPAQQAATFLRGSKLGALGGAKRVAISQFCVEVGATAFAAGGRSSARYDAIANPDTYHSALTQYGAALESALIAMMRPVLAEATSN